jgi:hypothetical protein
VKLLAESPAASIFSTHADAGEQIDHIKQLVEQLAGMPSNSGEAHALVVRIRDSLDRLKRHIAE